MIKSSRRIIYLSLGWVFTALGFLGAFLPVMPTTPFLLVAVWAFSKSSPRLKRWLYTHPKFGEHIRNWFDHGAVSKKAKIAAVSLMGISLGFSILLSENIYVPISLAVIMVATATFILTRPSPSGVAIKSQ
ncbi:YbaN family protein [Terasakiella sp. A23]|uniref:YbaN family protein n=1 Tax=Terasakiella sp. FCG-A23 TaxID=3080561 RepID=UPI002954C3C8|nr:YbaN family protein [Terasakiella sp. A23]MDV7340409.1 YbaN family protein [Terasakiella sp. A23]